MSVAISSSYAVPFPKTDLWLPVSYQQHYNQLLKAAKMVSGDPDCYELLQGTLAESRSTPENPVFTFRCRTEKRQMFSILVDSTTFKVTNILSEFRKQRELKEELAKQEELRKKELEREKYWKVCKREFKKKTRLFESLKVQSEFPPAPKVTGDGTAIYRIRFEAKSLQKRTILYRAIAKISSLDQCDVTVKPI